MADNKNWMNDLWKELTKPPKWMKDAGKPPASAKKESDKKEGGKKAEADASKSPKKRQPPAWWSWSTSDGVPTKPKPKPKKSGTAAKKSISAPVKKSRGTALSPLAHSQGDLGSAPQLNPSDIQSQFRRHGYAPGVLKPFGLDVTKVEPFGPVLRLRTNKGLVALKKTDLSTKHVQFLYDATLYLEQNKFTKYAPFLTTTDGLPYATLGGATYYATRWVRGQEVNFHSLPQVALTARTLAEFHEASRGWEPKGYRPSGIFDLVQRFADRKDELAAWKQRAQKKSRPDQVDKVFLKHADLYIKQCDQALSILRKPEVRAHLLYEEDDPVLCHLDLTPYNMIYTTNHQVALIDFDFSTFGPRTLDLAHVMRRAMQRQDWDEDVAHHSLINYNSVRMLTPAEYMILHALFIFPHRFWRIAYQHYDVGHDPHHLGYFQLAESEEENRQKFITRFGRQVERMQR